MNQALTLRNFSKGPLKYSRYWGILLVVILGLPLIMYAYMGTFMRLIGDDYCYAWVLTQNGFWKAQTVSYLQVSIYNGNRYSLSFFSFLADLMKPAVNGWIPGLVVIMFVLGVALGLWRVARLVNIPSNCLFILAGAVFLCLMTLTQAPDLYQILYWRAGMLAYLAPLIASTFLLAFILWRRAKPYLSWLVVMAVFLWAVISGGFSETGFAFQMAYLVILMMGWLLTVRWKGSREFWLLLVCLAAFLGTILAGLLMALSPTNQARLAYLPPRPDWVTVILSTIQNMKIFSAIILKTLFVPSFVGFILPFTASILFYASLSPHRPVRLMTIFVKLGLVFLIGFLMLGACFMPSAYIQASYPGLRALISARFVLVLVIASSGWLVGQFVVRSFSQFFTASSVLWLITAGMILLAAFYTARTIPGILAEQPKFQKWARLWDERDLAIREASQQNVDSLEVIQLDHVIPDVGELSADPGYWYNQCAAGYYGVDSISANQPGWDD